MASPLLRPPLPATPRGQYGAALATALILLVIATLLVLGATRFTALEEKMAGGILDRAIAFQSAEAGLRRAETLAEQSTPPTARPNDSDGTCTQTACSGGLCAPPDPDCPPRWKDPSFTGWIPILSSSEIPLSVEGFYEYLGDFCVYPYKSQDNQDQEQDQDPRYYVTPCAESEPEVPKVRRYRVTVRAVRTSGSTVILESYYQIP